MFFRVLNQTNIMKTKNKEKGQLADSIKTTYTNLKPLPIRLKSQMSTTLQNSETAIVSSELELTTKEVFDLTEVCTFILLFNQNFIYSLTYLMIK